MGRLPVSALKPGMTLAEPVLNTRRQRLAEAGTALDARKISLFQAWGVVEVEVQEVAAPGLPEIESRLADPPVLLPAQAQLLRLQVQAIVLVPLATLQEVQGMALFAIERAEKDVAPHELKLLSILAGQAALALESVQLQATLQQQRAGLEEKVHQRTIELETELKKALEANERLALVDRMRESLLAMASHE